MPVADLFDVKTVTARSPTEKPRLLLHCCCAPCASYVIEALTPYFELTLFYFNPNTAPLEEYEKRAAEFYKLPALTAPAESPGSISLIICEYSAEDFNESVRHFLDEPEGGLRCRVCFRLRLMETAKRAKNMGFDYFTTTLSVSPHKNAGLLGEIGGQCAAEWGVEYLSADFKKRGGYMRSLELSKQYGLYRQNYCGCKMSAGRGAK